MPMQPIRWDNVGYPGVGEASRSMSAATQTLGNAFTQLQDVLKQREGIDANNAVVTRNNNTTDYLNGLFSKYTDANKLNEAIQSGAVAQDLASYGHNIDANAVRGAADTRLAALQQQGREKIAYDHMMTDERVAPILDQYKALLLKPGGADSPEAAALQAKYQELGGRNLADLASAADARKWEITNRGITMDKYIHEMATSEDNIRHNKAMEGISQTNANTQADIARNQEKLTNYQIETGTQDRATAKAAGQAQALKSSLAENGNLYAKEGIYTGNQADELRKFIKDSNVGDGNVNKQSEVMNVIQDLQNKGIPVKDTHGNQLKDAKGNPIIIHDIPMSAVKAAISTAGDPAINFGWNTGPAKEVRKALIDQLGSTYKDANGNEVSRALEDLRTFTDVLQRARDNAPPIRSVGSPIGKPIGGGRHR